MWNKSIKKWKNKSIIADECFKTHSQKIVMQYYVCCNWHLSMDIWTHLYKNESKHCLVEKYIYLKLDNVFTLVERNDAQKFEYIYFRPSI